MQGWKRNCRNEAGTNKSVQQWTGSGHISKTYELLEIQQQQKVLDKGPVQRMDAEI